MMGEQETANINKSIKGNSRIDQEIKNFIQKVNNLELANWPQKK